MLLRQPQSHLFRLGWPGLVLFLGLCSLYFIFWNKDKFSFDAALPQSNSSATDQHWLPNEVAVKLFWKELAKSLESARPDCSAIYIEEGQMSEEDKNWEPFKEKTRPNKLDLSEEDERELAKKNHQFRLSARRLGPSLPIGNGTGIVTTASLDLVPVLLVSLRLLRRTGCELPVQVFLGDRSEYNQTRRVCNELLPTLNARCHVISDVYSTAEGIAPPQHFQFKVLAILFSTFTNVLFLDADAFPVHDPTRLLRTAPYTTHGLVTWTGFYANTASSHFYHIAGINVPTINPGTESGIILLNKEKHRESLLMMVYYNYYGPEYYYPLQAQGGPGQGDKETFGAGAQTVGAPLYVVKTPVRAIGRHVNDSFVFAGAAQADPEQDFVYEAPPPSHIHPSYLWSENDDFQAENNTKVTARALFVHTVSSNTKLDPGALLKEGGLAWMENEEEWHRIWGDEEWGAETFGFDVEQRMWECVQEQACWSSDELCSLTKRYRARVFGAAI